MNNTLLDTATIASDAEISAEIDRTVEFQNAMNTFYMLKGEYDDRIQDLRRKISKRKGLSMKEKRDEFKKARPSCVNCNRRVGSIFEVKYDEKADGRVAKALCGDRLDPCPLNIEINLGKIRTIADDLQESQDEMAELKKRIVMIKNDILFGYITTDNAVQEFEKIKADLSNTTEMYEILLVSYMAIYDNPEKKSNIKRTELEIFNDIRQIKKYIQDYNREGKLTYVQDAMTLLISQLTPKIDNLRGMKYPVMTVDVTNNQCTLVQKRLEYSVTENDSAVNEHAVVTFKVGIQASGPTKKSNKRDKSSESSEYVLE